MFKIITIISMFHLKRFLLILLIHLSYFTISNAQIDVEISYQNPTFDKWDELVSNEFISEEKMFKNGYGVGLAYRIYPFSTRIGFTPQLSSQVYLSEYMNDIRDSKYQILQFALDLPIQIFPFDLEGDCNCPTFGKQNDFFQKAIYFKVIPGITFQNRVVKDISEEVSNQWLPSIGAGVGLNIAINDLITLAPEFSYKYLIGANWKDLSFIHDSAQNFDESPGSILKAGIRLSFYFTQ